jgi:hypothetical protein
MTSFLERLTYRPPHLPPRTHDEDSDGRVNDAPYLNKPDLIGRLFEGV